MKTELKITKEKEPRAMITGLEIGDWFSTKDDLSNLYVYIDGKQFQSKRVIEDGIAIDPSLHFAMSPEGNIYEFYESTFVFQFNNVEIILK
jgi:hypothetical protein